MEGGVRRIRPMTQRGGILRSGAGVRRVWDTWTRLGLEDRSGLACQWEGTSEAVKLTPAHCAPVADTLFQIHWHPFPLSPQADGNSVHL